ncbi:MAG: thioredoxin [Nanoarchaeota archaeon]|nr:thioredoxin [Nanoarchaeota archaeon]
MTNNDIVPELTNGEFDSFVKGETVFLDFFAEWCMPCTIMSPIIDDLSEEFRGKIKFGKVNVDDNQKIAQKFEISSIPTFVLLKDSQVLERISGSITQDELEEILNRHL